MTMTLTAERVATALQPRPVRFFETVGSTNDEALAWLASDAPDGSVVVADEQTAGRGRMGRTWHTPPGVALALSVVLRVPSAEQITMVAALAVYDLFEALGLTNVGIKWPNDVLIGEHKACGILPEAVWNGDSLDGVVLGIGINVCNPVKTADYPATSIEAALGRSVDRVALLAVLLLYIDDWLEKLGTDALMTAWRQRLVTLGQAVHRGDVQGVAEDVAPDGALLVRSKDGELVRVVAGDVA